MFYSRVLDPCEHFDSSFGNLLFPKGFHEEVQMLACHELPKCKVSQVCIEHFQKGGGVAVPSIPKSKKILKIREKRDVQGFLVHGVKSLHSLRECWYSIRDLKDEWF